MGERETRTHRIGLLERLHLPGRSLELELELDVDLDDERDQTFRFLSRLCDLLLIGKIAKQSFLSTIQR